MATRTIKTGEDIDSALEFLASQANTNAEEYFLQRVQSVLSTCLAEADNTRYELVKTLLNDKDKGASISKLKELLKVK